MKISETSINDKIKHCSIETIFTVVYVGECFVIVVANGIDGYTIYETKLEEYEKVKSIIEWKEGTYIHKPFVIYISEIKRMQNTFYRLVKVIFDDHNKCLIFKLENPNGEIETSWTNSENIVKIRDQDYTVVPNKIADTLKKGFEEYQDAINNGTLISEK